MTQKQIIQIIEKVDANQATSDEVLTLFESSNDLEICVKLRQLRQLKIDTVYPRIRQFHAQYAEYSDKQFDELFGAFASISEIYNQLN